MIRALPPDEEWQQHVLPHGEIVPLAPRLWQVTGSLKHVPLPRNMIVYQLAHGGLLIHSAVALDEPTMAKLLEIGEPEVMIVPNRLHRLDAGVYKRRFPNLQVICPASEQQFVAKKVKVHGSCEEFLASLHIAWHKPDGLKPLELAYEFDISEKASEPRKALVLTDALFNIEDHLHGIKGWILRLMGSTGFFGLSKLGQIAMLQDAARYKSWLEGLAEIPGLEVISVAHGAAITHNASQRLYAAAARLDV